MTVERQSRPLTQEQTLLHVEECTSALIKHLQNTLALRLGDFNDLSRPLRRRSHYPTLLVIEHALKRVEQANAEAHSLAEYLLKQLLELRRQALEVRKQKPAVKGLKLEDIALKAEDADLKAEASRRTEQIWLDQTVSKDERRTGK